MNHILQAEKGRKGHMAVGVITTKPEGHDNMRNVFNYVKGMTTFWKYYLYVIVHSGVEKNSVIKVHLVNK